MIKKTSIKVKAEMYWIDIEKIIRFEAKSNTTTAYLAGNEELQSNVTLKFYEQTLHGKDFYRINDRDMINKAHVEQFNYRTRIVKLLCGTTLTVSFRKRRYFFDYMTK